MTDLDRFKEIQHLIPKIRRQVEWDKMKEKPVDDLLKHLMELDIEEQTLFEKLKKTQEFKDNFLEIFPWDNINSSWKVSELEKEIKELKTENSNMLLNFNQQTSNFENCIKRWNKLNEDSKTNIDKLKRIKQFLNNVDLSMIISVQNNQELQSILKDINHE